MEKALKNLEKLLPKTSFGGWNFGREIESWYRCLKIVQSMPGASRKFNAIASEQDVEQLLDTLAEVKFAVIFDQLGFQVEIEPSLEDKGILTRPDLKIMENGYSSIVEVRRFRPPGLYSPGQRLQNLPKEIPKGYVFPHFGDHLKDLKKIFNEIEKKFRQAGSEGIIAIWNSNDELVPYEFRAAAHAYKKVSHRKNKASFMIVRADPWEKFVSAELREDLTTIHQQWSSDLKNIVPDKILQNVLID